MPVSPWNSVKLNTSQIFPTVGNQRLTHKVRLSLHTADNRKKQLYFLRLKREESGFGPSASFDQIANHAPMTRGSAKATHANTRQDPAPSNAASKPEAVTTAMSNGMRHTNQNEPTGSLREISRRIFPPSSTCYP
jgi:hypothetical protein